MTDQKKYRVAIVGGAGTWGRFYLRTYARRTDCEIVGMVDRAQERRDAFAARYGISRTYDAVEDLLADGVPDIVSAVVPVSQNFPVVKACAEAGVRVVSCEKPISASLAEADEIVRFCRERGTLFGCAQAVWATPYMPQVMEWIHAGHIGKLTAAAIPGGLPREMSGGGCVQLAAIRLVTGMEVEWVGGWTLPPEPTYQAPGTPEIEADTPAYGRLGLSGGIVCEILNPLSNNRISTFISVEGEEGRAWLSSPHPVLIQGKGSAASPVFPEFLNQPPPESFFVPTIERLLHAFDTGEEPLSSGHDYRQALEIAIAMKISAHNGHQRVSLPLEDRNLKLFPHPYRLTGGDVAGWESIGYAGPPNILHFVSTFDDLAGLTDGEIQELMRHTDQKDLVQVLTQCSEAAKERVMDNLSERVRTFIAEELEHMDPPPAEEVETAQQRILEIVRSM